MRQTLLLLFLASFACQAQEIKWPIRLSKAYNKAPVRQGYAVTKNGDTAKGFIKLLPYGKFYDVLDTGTNRIRGLYYQIVAFMRIYDAGPDGPFTDYFNLSYKHRLWRLLGALRTSSSFKKDYFLSAADIYTYIVTQENQIADRLRIK
jgi:hypothetical protein